ncbi:putative serine protease K12H4.7 [Sitodiplosis mosellana]|uniref:putative serine protease K12H4.7 n=1 Tax=Sitodiplosis mosellana TaxID=263140 RepID=UPI002444FAA4|nr:putative serine protease K12H4.7 [Sitodiplosis mosellana]
MRYLKNEVHFKNGGPVFIMIGGEWKISEGHILPGRLIYDMAKENNGLLIYTEHRFYGKSWPTNTTSTENLKYLSVDQSLADLAHFVREITSDKELNATGGVIMVGGSYSATMAAWFRQKYPHLVNGAWASSAPFQAKVNYFEYTETVGKSISEIGGDECYQTIETTFKSLEKLLDSHDIDTLKALFKICDGFDITNKRDIWNFVSYIKDIFSGLVQGYRNGQIEKYCEFLSNKTFNSANGVQSHELYPLSRIFLQGFLTSGEKCVSITYEHEIEEMKNSTVASATRPWFYQTCAEYGWYQTTNSNDQPFGSNSPVEYCLSLCRDVFGDAFGASSVENNVNHTNVMYGGLDPAVTNVYFTHGSLDPWHRMGILEDLNEHSPGIVITGISHCQDMASIKTGRDSEQLIASKVKLQNLVKKWLKN